MYHFSSPIILRTLPPLYLFTNFVKLSVNKSEINCLDNSTEDNETFNDSPILFDNNTFNGISILNENSTNNDTTSDESISHGINYRISQLFFGIIDRIRSAIFESDFVKISIYLSCVILFIIVLGFIDSE
jgi:hypothetical protein